MPKGIPNTKPALETKAEVVEQLVIQNQEANTPLTEDKLPTKSAAINQAIVDFINSHNTSRQLGQIAACSAINHVAMHGDIRIIRNLLENMATAKVTGRSNMAAFIDKYAPVSVDDDGKFHFDKARMKEYKARGIAAALAEPWWTVGRQEADYKPTNLKLEMQNFLKRMKGKLKNLDATKGDVIPLAALEALEKVYTEVVIPLTNEAIGEPATATKEAVAA